jgi:hypothetical protein
MTAQQTLPCKHSHVATSVLQAALDVSLLPLRNMLRHAVHAAAAASGPLGTSSATGQVDFSPAFIWLLRDFQLRLESNGRKISPAEYLEEALLPVKGGEADIANRNQVGIVWEVCLMKLVLAVPVPVHGVQLRLLCMWIEAW